MEQIIKVWCITGIFAITIIGSIIHFIYPWSGNSKIMGLMFPVNESVWEHLKLGYWALVIFSIPEYIFINKLVNNYFLAKLAGIIVFELMVLFVFYGYFLFTRKSLLWMNIFSFFIGALTCQLLVYRIYRITPVSVQVELLSLAGFIIIAILFGILTFFPPHWGIFKDKRDNIFGIYKEQ